jgi:hypothetical protein
MSRDKKLILLEMILIIIGSISFYFVYTYVQNSHDGYTELTIQYRSSASYTYNNTIWRFWYGYPSMCMPSNYPCPNFILTFNDSASPHPSGEEIAWYAAKGAVDTIGDLRVKVLEVYSDHIVILVKPIS